MKIVVPWIALLLLLVGCASGPPHCDRRLTPINSPGGSGDRAMDRP